MAATFQLAHCVEEASFTSAADLASSSRVWAVHQVEATVDFCPRNKLLTWALGGLNYQIEHHLFPRLPHTLYPAIAPIVERNCLRHGVRYTVQPSLRVALRSFPPPAWVRPRWPAGGARDGLTRRCSSSAATTSGTPIKNASNVCGTWQDRSKSAQSQQVDIPPSLSTAPAEAQGRAGGLEE